MRGEDFVEIQRCQNRYKNGDALSVRFRAPLLFVTIDLDGREPPPPPQAKRKATDNGAP